MLGVYYVLRFRSVINVEKGKNVETTLSEVKEETIRKKNKIRNMTRDINNNLFYSFFFLLIYMFREHDLPGSH